MPSFKQTFATATAITLLGSGAAFAQATACGGLNGQWIGGNAAASDIAVASTGVEQLTLLPLNTDYVSLFTLSAPASVRVEATGQNGGDTVIELRNDTGEMILEDDDSGGNGASRGEMDLAAGTYCLSTRSFGGDVMMAQVRVGLTEHEPLTAGNPNTESARCNRDTPARALGDAALNAMLAGDGISASNNATNVPFYRFTLDEASPLSLTATNEDADPVLYLFDNDGTLLAENDDFDGLSSRIDMAEPLPAGNYCIGIRALSNADAPIEVSVFEYDEEAIMTAMFDKGDASPTLDGSHPVENLGALEGRTRLDVRTTGPAVWYAIDVEEAGLLLIEGISVADTDPMIVLFDDVGREIQRNDDNAGSLDSLVAARVFPGQYAFAVMQPGGSGKTGTIRVVIERYVPAD